MDDIKKRALSSIVKFLIGFALLLFVPVWTLSWWQAWLFLAVFIGPSLAITLYLMKHDPALLRRRMAAGPTAEKNPSQKIIQAFAAVTFAATVLVPVLDHRLGWSDVPTGVCLFGDGLVLLGYLIVHLVFKANSFASATISIHEGQRVISTGPYALVRHPMYSAAVVMLTGVPLALGSWWGLIATAAVTLVLAWRLIDEERFLANNLPGYAEYRGKVRYRLLPSVW